MSRSVSTTTWYCFSKPPQVLTSATPGTLRNCGFTTQSCNTRNSVGVRFVSVDRTT